MCAAATEPSSEIVAVRMYRGILGDCFLIRHAGKTKPTHILIDCGVLQRSGGDARIREIASDIKETVKGVLDLVIVTHEHADHVGGFGIAEDFFFADSLEIKQLWLAWTENREDAQANDLRTRFTKAKAALAMTLAFGSSPAVGEHTAAVQRRIESVTALWDFIGPLPAGGALPAAGRMTTGEVIERLKRKVGPRRIAYLEPGLVLPVDGGSALRAYVMGPPRSEKRLRKDKPSAGAAKEVYIAEAGVETAGSRGHAPAAGRNIYLTELNEAAAVESVARARLSRELSATDASRLRPEAVFDAPPFAPPHRRSIAEVESDARSKKEKMSKEQLASSTDVEIRYFYTDTDRKIEDDWLDAAEALALKLDSDTNNTSLVLAFELPDGQILLFPGDAQVGNWLSWRDQPYPGNDGSAASVTVDEILSHVTLYKVGHHASHNATLRELGLEKMTDPRLIAMIPVVEAVAQKQNVRTLPSGEKVGGWKMPYGELYAALKTRTSGRVLRGDGDPEVEKGAFQKSPVGQPGVTLTYAKGKDPLWVEVALPLR